MKKLIDEELNKISNMPREQRWDYFKAYYLSKTIILLVGIVLLIWFVSDTIFQKEIVNSGCVYGVEISEEEKNALTEGYLNFYKYNPKKYCAYISTDNMFEGTEQQMDANTHEMALFAQIAAGEIYYLILDKDNLEKMASGGIYASLDDVFVDGLPEEVEGCEVELTDAESGNLYKAAIDLKKAGILKDGREGYLVYTIGVKDKDYPVKLLKFLLSM